MLIAQSGLTLCDPMDCSLPGSPVHGILQARILEWVPMTFSRDWTQVSCIAGGFFTIWYLFLLFFGTLHSDAYIFPFLLCFLLLFFSQLFVRSPQTAILLLCIFFPMGMVLILVSCTLSQTSVHSSPGTLSIRSSFSLPLYNHKGFDLGHTWMV